VATIRAERSVVEPRLGASPIRFLELKRGDFDLRAMAPRHDRSVALLVVSGLMFLELEIGRARAGWLFGEDDLIRPWDMLDNPLTPRSRWRTLAPARIAVLDAAARQRLAGNLPLTEKLFDRAARTSAWLLAKSLVTSSPRVEERLLLWFAMAAERWGKVTPDGVSLELPLTHDLLAALVGARRPTITTGLRSLEASGLLTREGKAWRLRRISPGEAGTRDPALERCLQALGLDGDSHENGVDGDSQRRPLSLLVSN
jgi:CRP/FNR family cyclic AMP-dependent transcriptional regulator